MLYQLSYTSIPADLHSIPHNDVFVKWFCKNILRSSKQVLIAEIFKFTDGCHGCSAVLTPRKPFGFCQGLSRFAIHVYIIPFFFLSCPGLCPQAPHRFLSLQRKASCRMLFHEDQRPSQNRHALRKARLQIPRLQLGAEKVLFGLPEFVPTLCTAAGGTGTLILLAVNLFLPFAHRARGSR